MMRVDDRANRAVHPLCRLRTDKIFPRFVFIDDKMPVARCGQHHFQHPGEKRFLLVKGFDLPARQSDIHADNLQIRFLDIKIFTQQHVSCAIDVIFHQLPLRA